MHDTAIGLQLPESINENEWIYVAPDGEKWLVMRNGEPGMSYTKGSAG